MLQHLFSANRQGFKSFQEKITEIPVEFFVKNDYFRRCFFREGIF